MNLHIPQTSQAQTELYHLAGILNQVVSPSNPNPQIKFIQFFIRYK